jgi:hypothetical protein
MRIKLVALLAFILFCGCFAHSSPIAYTFTNASSFTLDGVNYTGPYLGLPMSAPQLTFTMYADTSNVFAGSFSGNTSGTGFILNKIGTTTVSYGDTTLATLTDSIALVISTTIFPSISLVDETIGETILSDPGGPYDGVSNFLGTNPLLGGFPSSLIGTSAGQLVITSHAYQGQFKATVGATAPAPEPSTIGLLMTGALTFAVTFRRRLLQSRV